MDYSQIYRDYADDYDALVSAEDAEGQLGAALRPLLPTGGTLVDVGAGTGRMSRLFTTRAQTIIGIEPAPAMLEIARARAAQQGHVDWKLLEGDARALPVEDQIGDLVVAGWVFGHFRQWLHETWRDEVDKAVAEMRRVAKPSASIVIVETLGTNHTTPRNHAALDEYFEHLESTHGMTRQLLRTDYRFENLESAVRLLGRFFGESMGRAIQSRGVAEVPECTGLWVYKPPKEPKVETGENSPGSS